MVNELASERWLERQDQAIADFYYQWKEAKKLGYPAYFAKQPWRVIKANTLVKEWNYNLKTSLVHEKVIEKMVEIVLENITKLYVNTVLFGHTESNPFAFAEFVIDEGVTEEEFDELLEDCEYWACDEKGQWRISDYGMQSLMSLAWGILNTTDYNKQLYLIDQVLNVVHQRSDLASWFVEGGTRTLCRLADREEQ